MIAPADKLPPLPDWIDAKLIEETKATLEPCYGRSLTTTEVVEILQNLGRLLDCLE